MKVLISLIGEQPIPNLLPIKLEYPDRVVLIHSDFTVSVAHHLDALISVPVILKELDAYSIAATEQYLRDLIATKEWKPADILFNLTGGTKPMSLGAFRVAVELGSRAIYLRTQGQQQVHFYDFAQGSEPVAVQQLANLPSFLDIETFLKAFRCDNYAIENQYAKHEPGRSFERAVHLALQSAVDQIVLGIKLDDVVDIDLAVRCGNEVGLIECKVGENGLKKAIDQINTAGGRGYLGTYTRKFIVSNVDWARKTNLSALAQARRIRVIELTDYTARDQALSQESAEQVQKEVAKALGKSL